MILKTLYLKNFRNYKGEVVEFSPHINAFCGPNAQGKTNLLEAIYFLVAGRSFRTHHLSDLIAFGASEFYLEALFEKNGIDHVLKMQCDGQKRRIFLNATQIPSLSALLGILIGVLLAPEDHSLIKGNPAERRQFLDLQIAQASPFYLHHLTRYNRALRHRNHLLRRRESATLPIWEEEMAASAEHITRHREQAVRELSEVGAPFQAALSGEHDALTLSYKSPALASSMGAKAYFLAQYAKHRKRELDQGTTLYGPHKDDLIISLGGREARGFASEGQQRSSVAALRLAEWSRLVGLTGTPPFFAVDDVGISFDRKREENLFAQFKQMGQVFLTSPRSDLPLPKGSQLFHVESGSVTS